MPFVQANAVKRHYEMEGSRPPPLDPALFHACGYELVGPPLAIE
jgi:hypothetical protein